MKIGSVGPGMNEVLYQVRTVYLSLVLNIWVAYAQRARRPLPVVRSTHKFAKLVLDSTRVCLQQTLYSSNITVELAYLR